MTFKWKVTPNQAFAELYDAYTNTLFLSGRLVMGRKARDMQQWARHAAPWTDRTKEARRLLRVTTEDHQFALGTIRIQHGVRYGLWLEIAYGGKWAIITKTIDYWGPLLMRDVQGMMNLKLISK